MLFEVYNILQILAIFQQILTLIFFATPKILKLQKIGVRYIATEEFLLTHNPAVLGSKQDYALLQDLRDTATWTLHYDYSQGISVEFIQQINAHMTRTATIEPGKLRTAANILVHTQFGDYFPPIPQKEHILALRI